jgi:hypothetical protein
MPCHISLERMKNIPGHVHIVGGLGLVETGQLILHLFACAG